MGEVFKAEFDPILLPGQTARIITETQQLDVECVAVGAMPEYMKDFGALTAATWATDKEDVNLEMGNNGLAQLRMRVSDDIKVQLKNLISTNQWRTIKTNFYLRQFPQGSGEDFLKEYMFRASEIFVYENDTPRFDLYSDIALATSRILFSGWRFRLKQITAPGKATIWVSGWPSGKGS